MSFSTGVGYLSTAQPSIKALQTLPSGTDYFITTVMSYGSKEYSTDTMEAHKGEDSEELMKVKTVKRDGGNQQSERGPSRERPEVHQQTNVIGYNESDPMLRLSGSEMETENDTGETQHDTEITEVMVSDETKPTITAAEVEDRARNDTHGGNIFVLTVMAKSKLIQETTFIIRASLASADLLMGLVPASLAVYDHISLMNGRLTLRDLSKDFLLTSFPYIVASQSPGFQQLRFQRKSFLPVLASFTFNVSAMVSLLTLALLSLERLWVMRGRPLSRTFMVRGVLLSWLVGLLLSFLVSWRKEGIELAGYFDPVTKLTLNIGAGATSVSGWVFYLEVSVMGVAGTTVIVCGITTLVLFMSHHRLSSSILKIHSSNRDNEVRRTTITFVLMVVMFIIGVGLVAVDITANLAVTNPLAHWLSWWVFVAASSWNWALYTLSGGRFRNQIRNLLPRVQVQHTKEVKNTTKAQQISFGRKTFFTKQIPREKKATVELKGFARSYTFYSK
ncbi:hypothetical protein Pcinc_013796 [Petrolisthes cinctipes]|uniref:G-protein coupled receptors family 1 profile domain-containing protein n=1 Tax=Petrolisthes cinctipes TaxID=88211 RepID=A0AAE1G1Q6_PETCI|nr:hypothetical protein Pcinc_013796 [Petrolisthes cinctipes]